MTAATFRRDYLSKPIFHWARQVLPTLSDTEREAIEAGDTWWDAELFAGNPDWRKLLAMSPAKLTAEEQAFLDGPVAELCGKLDEWRITWELRDLPPEVWDFLKRHKFFAMIIPKRYGGLGFSATAHSEVIRKISTRSLTAAVTAMVPNSLGPGKLLLHFGTKAQQDYWLPRLTAAVRDQPAARHQYAVGIDRRQPKSCRELADLDAQLSNRKGPEWRESRRCPSSPSPQARAQDRQIPWNGAKTGSIPSELAAYNNFQSTV